MRKVAETGQDIPPSIIEELALADKHFTTAARRLIRLARSRQLVRKHERNLEKAVQNVASARMHHAEAMSCTPPSSKDTDEESPHPAPTRAPDPPRPPPTPRELPPKVAPVRSPFPRDSPSPGNWGGASPPAAWEPFLPGALG